MLKVKVFLNLAYNDVIRKVLLKGRFGVVDWRVARQTAFSARPCAAAAERQTMWRTLLSPFRFV